MEEGGSCVDFLPSSNEARSRSLARDPQANRIETNPVLAFGPFG